MAESDTPSVERVPCSRCTSEIYCEMNGCQRLAASPAGLPVLWQWRKKGDAWTLEKTFTFEVFATTDDSEVRPLYALPLSPELQKSEPPHPVVAVGSDLQTALLPCPFCGFKFPSDEGHNLIDVVYPTGSYAHWMDPNDHAQGLHFNREPDGAAHELSHVGCTENMGGCGASIVGLGRDGAMAAWNRRAACEASAGSAGSDEKAPAVGSPVSALAVSEALQVLTKMTEAAQGVMAWWSEWAARQPQSNEIEHAEWCEFQALRVQMDRARKLAAGALQGVKENKNG